MSAVEIKDRYHTFWPRVSAAIIDGIVLMPLAFVADPDLYAPGNGIVAIAVNVVGYAIPILYSVLMHARYGQTLGKMAVRVRVLDLSESRLPTLRQAFFRDIGEIGFDLVMLGQLVIAVSGGTYAGGDEYLIPAVDALMWAGFGWTFLEIVTMLTNSKRRAVHDYIAHTVVVRDV